VLKRKRFGRIHDWSPGQSLAAIGITKARAAPAGSATRRNGSPIVRPI
jgi:hypothetical protein